MERLTEYDEFGNAELVGIDNTKLYERLICDETVALTIATNKLAKLEDVLEEFELTSAEDLRNDLNFKGNMAIWEGELNYKNKIADLEQELSELKQQLAIIEKALELACERVKYFEEMQDREMGFDDFFGYESNYDLQGIIEQYKEQAEKEVKGE